VVGQASRGFETSAPSCINSTNNVHFVTLIGTLHVYRCTRKDRSLLGDAGQPEVAGRRANLKGLGCTYRHHHHVLLNARISQLRRFRSQSLFGAAFRSPGTRATMAPEGVFGVAEDHSQADVRRLSSLEVRQHQRAAPTSLPPPHVGSPSPAAPIPSRSLVVSPAKELIAGLKDLSRLGSAGDGRVNWLEAADVDRDRWVDQAMLPGAMLPSRPAPFVAHPVRGHGTLRGCRYAREIQESKVKLQVSQAPHGALRVAPGRLSSGRFDLKRFWRCRWAQVLGASATFRDRRFHWQARRTGWGWRRRQWTASGARRSPGPRSRCCLQTWRQTPVSPPARNAAAVADRTTASPTPRRITILGNPWTRCTRDVNGCSGCWVNQCGF
jgi:hypothetical protein